MFPYFLFFLEACIAHVGAGKTSSLSIGLVKRLGSISIPQPRKYGRLSPCAGILLLLPWQQKTLIRSRTLTLRWKAKGGIFSVRLLSLGVMDALILCPPEATPSGFNEK